MKKALIVIDMQLMTFMWKNYGGPSLYHEAELLENTKKLLEKARKSGSPVFYIYYTERESELRQEGMPLWQIHPELQPLPGEHQIIKYHGDSFYETTLKKELEEEGIKDLVLCGIQTEFCVDTTCRSAFSNGFRGELVSDAHSTVDTGILLAEKIIEHHNHTLSQFVQVKTTEEILFSQG